MISIKGDILVKDPIQQAKKYKVMLDSRDTEINNWKEKVVELEAVIEKLKEKNDTLEARIVRDRNRIANLKTQVA